VSDVFAGSCQCGHCRYLVRRPSLTLFACHCRECLKQSGSAFGMALWVQTPQVEPPSAPLFERW